MDDMTGAGWAALGTFGDKQVNQFIEPSYVFVHAKGRIYVAVGGGGYGFRAVVQMDDMTGAGWTRLGTWGRGVKQFGSAAGVFVDAAGRISVADSGNNRIVRMDDMTGAGGTTVAPAGIGARLFPLPGFVFVR